MELGQHTCITSAVDPNEHGSTIAFPSFGQNVLRHKNVEEKAVFILARVTLWDYTAGVCAGWHVVGAGVVRSTEDEAGQELCSLR